MLNPVVHERGHAKPGEEGHFLVETRGSKGDRATGCGQSAVGPHGSSVRKTKSLLAPAKPTMFMTMPARDVCRVRAEQESVSALFLQVRAGRKKRSKRPPSVGCALNGPKVHAKGVVVPAVAARAVHVQV